MTSDREPSSRGRLKAVVRAAALLISIGFLAALVASQWQALRSFQWQFRPGWLLPSFVLMALASLLELSIWRYLLASLGGRLRWRRAAETWFLSNIVRYIPGNIWQFVGMAELAADDGVSRLTTFTSIAVHQVLNTAVGIALAALYFALAGQGALLDAVRPFLMIAPLGLLLCHPRLLERTLNGLLAAFKRPPVRVTLTWGQIGLVMSGYAAAWLIMGAGFACLAAAITPITAQQFVALMATWAAAYVVGYLSLLTPGGLGVREGVMILLLAPLFPPPVPTVIALSARLWAIIGEAVGAAIALVARARDRRAVQAATLAMAGEARDA